MLVFRQMTKVSDGIFSGRSAGERLIKMKNIFPVVEVCNYGGVFFPIFKLLSDILIFAYSLANKMT